MQNPRNPMNLTMAKPGSRPTLLEQESQRRLGLEIGEIFRSGWQYPERQTWKIPEVNGGFNGKFLFFNGELSIFPLSLYMFD
jgi:hypothetical protein